MCNFKYAFMYHLFNNVTEALSVLGRVLDTGMKECETVDLCKRSL